MSGSHEEAIKANIASFDEEFAKKYEQRESQQLLAILFVKYLLELNVHDKPVKRKTPEESSVIVGNPDKFNGGFSIESSLPDPKTYLKEYPHAIFRPGMKLLDFACGTGMVTELFVPYLTAQGQQSEIVGIDIGAAFLQYFNNRATKINSSSEIDMRSYQYDILDAELQPQLSEQFESHFDAIVCTLSYHHIHNYEQVTKKLATFLRPGGWLFIVDFYNEDVERVGADPSNPAVLSHAVQHMGGLKVDKLNHTLANISELTNVSSAREFRAWIWQPASFIESHCTGEITGKLSRGELRQRQGVDSEIEYLVDVSLIYAIGQKPC
ncbi:uncharacterized protein LODBEIA_P33860 [Lodderomyces beijingensis]|uniref:Methyltransferase domain-containing protein n=1 Tax=Lodderomyces beijingensis TaxID=1775926 RepID=A0ABP0ZM02_9ASCO